MTHVCLLIPYRSWEHILFSLMYNSNVKTSMDKSTFFSVIRAPSISKLRYQSLGRRLILFLFPLCFLVVASPSSSLVWIQYMAFHLQTCQYDQARAVAARAVERINFRYSQINYYLHALPMALSCHQQAQLYHWAKNCNILACNKALEAYGRHELKSLKEIWIPWKLRIWKLKNWLSIFPNFHNYLVVYGDFSIQLQQTVSQPLHI